MSMSETDLLNSLGEVYPNSQKSLIESNSVETDNNEPQLLKDSPYTNLNGLINVMKEKVDIFKCLSLDIQSLNAKIDQLRIYIEEFSLANYKFDAICIQETWLADGSSVSHLQIEGYILINFPCVLTSHSGLAIYLSHEFQYQILDIQQSLSLSWECLFISIELPGNKTLTLGNKYRPPRELSVKLQKFHI